jgi:hypothetical protein
MTKHITFICLLPIVIFASAAKLSAAEADLTEQMKHSIVYLKTSFYGYQQAQPWKHKDLTENWAVGCAVGTNLVITPAWNVADLAFIKALRYGHDEFVSAAVKLVDYESNLCLIELDPRSLPEPLKPLKFSPNFDKGAPLTFYWLSEGNHLFSGRAYLDRARVEQTNISFERRLHYVVANTSARTGVGQLYCSGKKSIGIACWSNEDKEAGVIPGEVINSFLAQAKTNPYKGFGTVGFKTSPLLDPTMRSFLKMPVELKTGVYVAEVYTIGTASDVLKRGDVILSIDGHVLNAYGRFLHQKYDRIFFHYLITNKTVGEEIRFEIWRDGQKQTLRTHVKNFKASDMLVPYYEYDLQPEYIVTGGYVLQTLTRPYLAQWGDGWEGQVEPHLFHYFRDLAFKPTDLRTDIVILSYVLPANINLGYADLNQLVVKKFNGMDVRCIADVLTAQKLNPHSKYDVIEFELDNPPVVIPRDQLALADQLISQNYGVPSLTNVRQP